MKYMGYDNEAAQAPTMVLWSLTMRALRFCHVSSMVQKNARKARHGQNAQTKHRADYARPLRKMRLEIRGMTRALWQATSRNTESG
eukprot:6190985-Pleurochrysis_carterae.AAC.2